MVTQTLGHMSPSAVPEGSLNEVIAQLVTHGFRNCNIHLEGKDHETVGKPTPREDPWSD